MPTSATYDFQGRFLYWLQHMKGSPPFSALLRAVAVPRGTASSPPCGPLELPSPTGQLLFTSSTRLKNVQYAKRSHRADRHRRSFRISASRGPSQLKVPEVMCPLLTRPTQSSQKGRCRVFPRFSSHLGRFHPTKNAEPPSVGGSALGRLGLQAVYGYHLGTCSYRQDAHKAAARAPATVARSRRLRLLLQRFGQRVSACRSLRREQRHADGAAGTCLDA